jgi:hypothetical protein
MNTLLLKPMITLRTISLSLLIIPLMLPLQAQADNTPAVGGALIDAHYYSEPGAFIVGVGNGEVSSKPYVQITEPDGNVCWSTDDNTWAKDNSNQPSNLYDFPDGEGCDNETVNAVYTLTVYDGIDPTSATPLGSWQFTYNPTNLARTFVPIGVYCSTDTGSYACTCVDPMVPRQDANGTTVYTCLPASGG